MNNYFAADRISETSNRNHLTLPIQNLVWPSFHDSNLHGNFQMQAPIANGKGLWHCKLRI